MSDRSLLLRVSAVFVVAALLAACGGRPVERVDLDGSTPEGDTTVPAAEEARIEGPCAEPAAVSESSDSSNRWQPIEPVEPSGCFSLAPESPDIAASAVEPGADFKFTSQAELTEDAVKSLLVADPPLTLNVEAADSDSADSRAFLVSYDQELPEGAPLRFTLHETPGGRALGQWAFQTAAPLSVVSTHPGSETSVVPVDTGVELTFSHDGVTFVDSETGDPASLMTIEPAVDGRFEIHRRTLVFVPAEDLAPGTIYTVSLAPGATAGDLTMDEPFEFAFETAVTDPGTGGALSLSRSVWQFPEGEVPALTGFASEQQLETVAVEVFRLPDANGFIASIHEVSDIPEWAWRTREKALASTDELPTVQSFAATVQTLDESFSSVLVPFPESLDPGYYLANLDTGTDVIQAWLQVSDLGAYAAVSPGGTLVWVHDVKDGAPINGATVRSLEKRLGQTDADGLLLEPADDLVGVVTYPWGAYWRPSGELVIEADAGQVVVPVGSAPGSEPARGFFEFPGGPESAYWRYLYTDRTLYRPSDTIRFWGVARDRDAEGPLELDVVVRGGDYFGYDGAPLEMASTKVTTSAAGTYDGALDFSGATPGFYSLEVQHDGLRLSSTGIEIKDFRAPAYGIGLTVEPAVAYADEPMTATATVSFFEGSPAPGIELAFDPNPGETVRTDASGSASAGYARAATGEPVRGNVEWRTISARVDQSEAGDISAYAPRLVFAAAIALEAEDEAPDQEGAAEVTRVLSGTVRAVELDGVERDAALPAEDYMGDGVEGVEVLGEIVKVEWIREQVGETYDFVTKETVPEYEYREQRTPAGDFTVVSDEDGRFSYELELEGEAGFEVTMTAEDEEGRRVEVTHWVQSGVEAQPDEALVIRSQDAYETTDGRVTYRTFQPGDEVRLRLEKRGGDLDRETPAMFYQAAGGIKRAEVPGGLDYEFEFAGEHVPNTNVVGVIFDGRSYDEVEVPFEAALDKELQRLTVEVTSNQESYEPGVVAELEVVVTDANGDPAEAEVLLSAVDAAVVAAQGGDPATDVLAALYQHIGTGVVRSYSSHVPPAAMRGAEGGGGGDGRSDFKDTALFTTVQTDESGRAQAQLELPDNLTSWRVTGIAVTGDLKAGNGLGLVPVSLPVFVDLTAAESYVVDDEPDARLRAFGTALEEGDPVALELGVPTIEDAGGFVEGVAFEPAWLSLGSLVEGAHELHASVETPDREYFDSLVRPFSVVPSRLAVISTTTQVLEAGEGAEFVAGGPLVVTDAGRGALLEPLQQLANNVGDRADQAMARHVAGRILEDQFSSGVGPAPFHPTNYQTSGGGIALFPYGDEDLDTSAWSALADPSVYGAAGLIQYFTVVADDPDSTRERQLVALQGLAALGQPVLASLSTAPVAELDPAELLTLAVGLAAAGDLEGARSIYGDLIAQHGERLGQMARLNIGADDEASTQSTARAAALGAMIGDPYAPYFFEYVRRNPPSELPVDLETVTFLGRQVTSVPVQAATVLVTLDGEEIEIDLAEGPASFAAFSSAEVEVTDGRAAASQTRMDASTAEASADGDGPSVSRTMTVDGGEETTGDTLSVVEGDRVVIRLDVDLGQDPVEGCYQVTDLLPTGLIAVTPMYDPNVYYEDTGEGTTRPHSIDGQRVSFCVWESDESRALEYSARVLSTGSYVAEPAVIQAMAAPELRGFSESATVVIEPAVR